MHARCNRGRVGVTEGAWTGVPLSAAALPAGGRAIYMVDGAEGAYWTVVRCRC
jgi:hypothetical protein